METTKSEANLKRFWDYSDELFYRLQVGAKQYGDKSFERKPVELIDEIQQELLDVSGWAFILWTRLEQLKRKVEGI